MKNTQYLLDSSICIYFLRGNLEVKSRLLKAGWNNCHISEITLIELLYGAECSNNAEANKREVLNFCSDLKIVPIYGAIEEFARQKAALRKSGQLIEDFDLLIGTTAIVNNMTIVTDNTKHFARLSGIKLDNWVIH